MNSRTLSIIGFFTAVCLASVVYVHEAKALISSHNCADCHSVMGASGSTLLNDANVEVLCMSCHVTAIGSVSAAEVHTNDSPTDQGPFRHTCLDCHTSHDNLGNWRSGTNIKLIGTKQDSSGLAKIATPNNGIREVAFESRGSDVGEPSLHSFADNDEDNSGVWDGICETCHTQTARHRNNSSGNHSHQVGKECTRCHTHGNGFNR